MTSGALGRLRTDRRRTAAATALAMVVAVLAGAFGWSGHRRRSGVDSVAHARPGVTDPARTTNPGTLPVAQWSERFQARQARGELEGLLADLSEIQAAEPDLYEFYRLGYLHARTALAAGRAGEARERLQPFLAAGNPLRDLALHHAAQAAAADGDPEEAGRLRAELIASYPESPHRQRAVEEQAAWLASRRDTAGLQALAGQVGPDAALGREVEGRLVEVLAGSDPGAAAERGLRLLRANAGDDPAERMARILDRPEVLDRLGPEEWALLGESARSHRHYDRAIALLERALPGQPAAKRADLLFAIGRAHFHAERYADAEKRYLEAAEAESSGEARANALYNAARSAQLQGDEARAEAHLGRAIALGKGTSRASSALTQRLRIRARHKRYAEAAADLRRVRKEFPRSHAVVEASLAYATAMVAAGRGAEAVRAVTAIKPRLMEKIDVPELQYWHARALERRSPVEAVRLYLRVMAADAPTHHFYLARERLEASRTLLGHARALAARLEKEGDRLVAAGKAEAARDKLTDAFLVSPAGDRERLLARLRAVYQSIPSHREVLELPQPTFPRLPLFGPPGRELESPDRLDLLLALGLFDDASDLILKRYPLHPLPNGVARAEALRRALSGRASLYAIEVAMEDVPEGYRRELLPRLVRELLYPLYFWDAIRARAREHGADPRLVLSIMREESRFNVRAKSPAAARGLLQFIIGTARKVGEAVGLVEVQPDDLYDPEVIIRLGAKYIGDLQSRFDGDPYKAAAAYNAGPNQAELWARLVPTEGEDQFLAAVNFEETKNYVRKVMNTYERYRELYGDDPDATAPRVGSR